jgi:hypothetical protein
MARPQANGHAKAGQRKMSVTESVTEVIEAFDETLLKQENIFLFVPNLIGMLFLLHSLQHPTN